MDKKVGVFAIFATLILLNPNLSFARKEVEIQGAAIVNDDGCLLFCIENNLDENITVCFLNQSSVHFLEPNNSLIVKTTTPKVKDPIKVSYVFEVTYHSSNMTKEYVKLATIVPSDLVWRLNEVRQKLVQYSFLLTITTGICILLGSAYVIEQIFKVAKFLGKKR